MKNKLTDLQSKCKVKDEESLGFYCSEMKRVLSIFSKIKEMELLDYVETMIKPASDIIVKYFIERVNACLNEEDELKKAKIRQDVEESMVEFCEMLEVLIHSANKVDQIFFQTSSLDWEIRRVPSKLCGYYSQVLNDLAEIFRDDTETKYAFCVYPSLNVSAENIVLFSTSGISGKVCVIKVPSNKIAKTDQMLIILFHEFFHVLPNFSMRNRKHRGEMFLRVISYFFVNTLYEGCALENKYNQLTNYLFTDIYQQEISKIQQYDSKDIRLYSNNLQEELLNDYIKELKNIQWKSVKDYMDVLYEKERWGSYSKFEEELNKTRDICSKIRINCQDMLSHNKLIVQSNLYMQFFREVFCDMLALIILKAGPDRFYESLTYRKRDGIEGEVIVYRAMFVSMVLSSDFETLSKEQEIFINKWKEWKKEKNIIVSEIIIVEEQLLEKNQSNRGESENIKSGERTNLPFTNVMKQIYMQYFYICCKEVLEFERRNQDKIDKFRSQFGLEMENEERIKNIIVLRGWEK